MTAEPRRSRASFPEQKRTALPRRRRAAGRSEKRAGAGLPAVVRRSVSGRAWFPFVRKTEFLHKLVEKLSDSTPLRGLFGVNNRQCCSENSLPNRRTS